MTSPSTALHLLHHWNVPVVPLPAGTEEQSDYLASLGRSKFLIEEKVKFDDPAKVEERSKRLDAGEIHLTVKSLVRSNRMSGLVRKAVKQLESSGTQYEHDFRLIWFTGTGPNAEAYYGQFIATLYGTTRIIEMNSDGMRTCYFFRNSEFHRHAQSLDGAVAAHLSNGKLSARLCLNPLSPRFARLRRTKFTKLFGSAIEDPLEAEKRRVAYIVTSSTSREDEGALLRELELKYKTKPLMRMDVGFNSFSIRVGA
jgi:hypothetical protein